MATSTAADLPLYDRTARKAHQWTMVALVVVGLVVGGIPGGLLLAIAGQHHGGRRGQDFEGVTDGRLPLEVDLQDPKRFAEARRDRFDRGVLGGPAGGAARGREDD